MAGWVLLAAVVLGGPWVLAALALWRARRAEARVAALERTVQSGRSIAAAAQPVPAEVRTHEAPAPLAAPPPELATVPPPVTAPVEGPAQAGAAEGAQPGRGVGEVPAHVPAPRAAPASLEERVALVGFARIGAAVFLLGAAYFFKYAVDNAWIGPAGRVALGLVVGVALLLAGEWTAARARAAWVHTLLGTALAVLFAAVFASHALYDLVPVPVAFGGIAIVALLGGALALRHQGELVLGLALLGGLAAPVILGSGDDRPAALFGYLALLAALTLAASARARFRLVPWGALLAPALLFGAWYARWFDAAEPLAPELGFPGRAAGAYYTLGARIVPLAAVAVFVALGLAFARAIRRRGAREPEALAFEAAALLLGHLGAAALLLDRPWALGVALALLGAAAVLVFRRAGRPELLGLPLAAAFVALLVSASTARGGAALPALAVLAAWAVLYAAAFLAAPGGRAGAARTTAHALTAAAGAALLAVAGVLLRELPVLLAAVVAAGLAAAALARRAPGLLAGGALLGALGLLRSASTVGPDTSAHPVLALAALWALVAAAAAARTLVAAPPERRGDGALALAAAAAPGVGLLALALVATDGTEELLRAGAAGLAGALELALGALAVRAARAASASAAIHAPLSGPRPQVVRAALRPASLLLGEALALLAAALAFLLTGASITVAWALLAAVVAHLAARSRDRDGLLAALGLFAAALGRALTVDLGAGERLVARYAAALGRDGAPGLRPVLNERSLALAAVGLAALLAARVLARAAPTLPLSPPALPPATPGARRRRLPAAFGAAAAALVAAGHLSLLLLLGLEAADAVVSWPAPPVPGSAVAVRLWEAARVDALALAEGRQNMVLTLVLGAYAAALVAAGFAARERVHRWLGLGLFALTLAKLALHDIWSLARPYQVAVLLGVGALLLAASFLYARYGTRLLAMLGGPPRGAAPPGPERPSTPGPGGAAAVLLLALGVAAPARALDATAFAVAAPVDGVTAPGLWRFELPPEAYAASRAGEGEAAAPGGPALPAPAPDQPRATDLRDLRVEGPGGAEVPFVLRDMGPPPVPDLIPGTLLDPVTLAGGGRRAVLDLGPAAPRHDAVALGLAGATFLRRVKVESSDDGRRWGELGQGRVWRVPSAEGAGGDTVRYPISGARYLRVTVLPGEGEVKLTGGNALRAAPEQPAAHRERKVALLSRPGLAPRRTVVDLDLGVVGLPVDRLRLVVSTPAFERRVRVVAPASSEAWMTLSEGLVWRAARRADRPGAPTPEELEIAAPLLGRRTVRLAIDDGDDAPLGLVEVWARWPAREVVFSAASAGPHRLLLGAPGAGAPRYDLPALLARGDGPPIGEARLGALAANPGHGAPPPRPQPFTERHRTALGAALALVLAGLAAWAVVLLRRAPR